MQLIDQLKDILREYSIDVSSEFNQVTIKVQAANWHDIALVLRDNSLLAFDTLIDVCAVDYLHYGMSEWATNEVTLTGYSRARSELPTNCPEPRFASIYHLLSVEKNHRLRIVVPVDSHDLTVDSVVDIWPVANWFEREAYDLFGIVYAGHPDLRRILTDYGFIGHPLRKDFPLSGQVEIGYDASQEACVYQPVDIQPRVTVAKVVRDDERYNQTGDHE